MRWNFARWNHMWRGKNRSVKYFKSTLVYTVLKMWLANSMRMKSFLLWVFDTYQPALTPQWSWATREVHCSGIWDVQGSPCSLDFAQVLPVHRRHRFGVLWEGWSINRAAASGIPGLSCCVNREGGVCTSEYICGEWVQTQLREGGWANVLLLLSQLYIEDQKKNNQLTAVVRPKELQLNFIFQLLKHVWIVCIVKKKVRYFVSSGWQVAQRGGDCSVWGWSVAIMKYMAT